MYHIEYHGTSGKWHNAGGNCTTLEQAIEACQAIKNAGYGARASLNGQVVINAPWQEPVIVQVPTTT